jgi:hypothetical protein
VKKQWLVASGQLSVLRARKKQLSAVGCQLSALCARSRTAALIAVLLICGAAAMATTVIPMSVEELTRSASRIVEVQAVSSRSAWNQQHTLIYTYTTFRVTRALKGDTAQTMIVKQLGGSAEGYTQKVSGVHHAQVGEEALLFLRPSAAGDGTYAIVGLLQGHFRIFHARSGETMMSNGIVGAESLEGGSGAVREFTGSPMTLGAAEARIRRALQ